MYDLSIVIVNFNTPDLVLRCVESIKKNNGGLKVQVIVVDNSPTDWSFEVFKKGLTSKDILIFKAPAGSGFAAANNAGIKKAISEFVLLLNSDTEVLPGSLTQLLEFAKGTTNVGVVGPRLLNKDRALQNSCFNFPSIANAIKHYWLDHKFIDKFAPPGEEPTKVDAVVGAAFLITPVALKKVGLLSEKYFMYFEDIDYCRRVDEQNLSVYYFPKSKVIHLHGASAKKVGKDIQNKRLAEASKVYHGVFSYYLLTFIMWLGQKWQTVFK